MKLAKSAVGFEHPAKGSHHCSECQHFVAPDSCRIVAGAISPRDWCKRFLNRRAARQATVDRHLNSIAGSSY
jgi:hypothetical protein